MNNEKNLQEEQVKQSSASEIKSYDRPKAIVDYYSADVFNQMHKMADYYHKANALPSTDNVWTIAMKMQAGREMGMAPIESIKSFYFVKGVIAIYGAAITRRLREHGWRISYLDEHNKCTATVTRGSESYFDSLTFEEAEKSGWTKSSTGLKAGWVDGINRKLKLRYGVLSLIIKTYIPEVLGSAVDLVEVTEDAMPLSPEKTTKTGLLIENPDEPASEEAKATILAINSNVNVEGLTKSQAIEMIESITKGENK